MGDWSTERCDFCGGQAVALQRGARVCGRCGTRRTLGESPVILPLRSRRAAFISLLTSGLLLKLMMGSVALAAVTGLAAVSVLPPSNVAPGSSDSTVIDPITSEVEEPGDSSLTDGELDEMVVKAQNQAESAGELADAAKDWANCVADFAREHRGEGIHPQETCGEHPRPSEYGLGNENGNRGLGLSEYGEGNPGENRGNSADAPGRDTAEAALESDGFEKDKSKDKAAEDEKNKNDEEDRDD